MVVVQERLDHLGQGKSWNVFLVTNVELASLHMHWVENLEHGPVHEVVGIVKWVTLVLRLE